MAIIKHNNPCGLCSNNDLAEAYRRALAGDPLAAFGGVVSSNRTIDMATAQEIYKTHYDAIIAPKYADDALALLKRKKDFRIIALGVDLVPTKGEPRYMDFRRVRGGLLAQTPDYITEKELTPKTVTNREPTAQEREELFFAWQAVKVIKSNAIVLTKDKTLMGMGAGQPSRVVSVQLALERAGDRSKGSVLGSDAFFPFPDGLELAAKGGITAVIQPGGSVRDQEVIKAANEHNIAMVFTGIRHFRH